MVKKAIERPNKNRGPWRWMRGQSLVEFAVALPILLFIIAGIIEVGNIFVQRNRAALVARETARFVATGGDANDALAVSQQTVQVSFGGQVLAFDEEHMNIYVIHATFNSTGSAIIDVAGTCASETDFCDTHIYPTQSYFDTCSPDCVPDVATSGWTPTMIRTRLNQNGAIPDANLADLRVVAAVVRYNTTTLLNLPIFPQTEGGIPLNEIVIMRREATISEAAGTPTQGCSAYPILVGATALSGAVSGQTITVTHGTGLSNFTYALWNNVDLTGGKGARLADSLGSVQEGAGDPPIGNAKDATFGFIDPTDPSDTLIHKGDSVLHNDDPAAGGNALYMMNDHITDKRVIRILEYDSLSGGTANISSIIVAKLTNLTGGLTGTLSFEFVRRDNSCGNA